MKTAHQPQQRQQHASFVQCLGAAQADAERMYGTGPVPAWRPAARDWRPMAAAVAAASLAVASAVALLWPWDAPPAAGFEPMAAALSVAQRSSAVTAARSIAPSVASNPAGPQIDAPMASPFGWRAASPGSPSTAWASIESEAASTEAAASSCGADCPSPAAPAATMPVLAPGATLLAALPANLDAWALDPQPLAAPAATTASLQRPLGNTPELPNDNDPTPAQEAGPEPAEAPAQLQPSD